MSGYASMIGVDTWLKFKCDNCGTIHLATVKDTRFPGGLNCYCGHEVRFRPIKKLKYKPIYGQATAKATQKPKTKRAEKVKIELDHLVVDGLKQMGYSLAESKRLAEKYAMYSSEDAIKLALTQG